MVTGEELGGLRSAADLRAKSALASRSRPLGANSSFTTSLDVHWHPIQATSGTHVPSHPPDLSYAAIAPAFHLASRFCAKGGQSTISRQPQVYMKADE